MSKPTIPTTGNNALDGELLDLRKRLDAIGRGQVVTTETIVEQASSSPTFGGFIEVKETNGSFDQYVSGIEVDQADIIAAASGNLAKLNLAAVLAAGGPTGDSTHVAQITWDAKGRITAVSSVAIVYPTGGHTRDVAVITGNVVLASAPTKIYVRIVNAPAVNSPTITLPDPTTHTGAEIWIRYIATQDGNISIVRHGSEKIDNVAADAQMHSTGPDRITLISDSVDWWIIGSEL